jgi:hypothetical protein
MGISITITVEPDEGGDGRQELGEALAAAAFAARRKAEDCPLRGEPKYANDISRSPDTKRYVWQKVATALRQAQRVLEE